MPTWKAGHMHFCSWALLGSHPGRDKPCISPDKVGGYCRNLKNIGPKATGGNDQASCQQTEDPLLQEWEDLQGEQETPSPTAHSEGSPDPLQVAPFSISGAGLPPMKITLIRWKEKPG